MAVSKNSPRSPQAATPTRMESDSFGPIEVAADRYWGAQTERSRRNFRIGEERMPLPLVKALAMVKKAAALANLELGLIDERLAKAIVAAADEVIEGRHDAHFPLLVWQTGSGTQSNMNLNEVIANRASELLGGTLGAKHPIHPNDHVNLGQSSNDTFPTAMHIAAAVELAYRLNPALARLDQALKDKAEAFQDILKIGRTHLQDATPLTLGQEFGGYSTQVSHGMERIKQALYGLYQLAQGGTAVGTGLNAHRGVSRAVRRQDRRDDQAALRHRAEQIRGARGQRRLCVRARGAQHGRRLAVQDRQRHSPARLRPALGLRRASPAGERAWLLDHAGQGEPDAVRGGDHGRSPSHGQQRHHVLRRQPGHLELNVFKPLMAYAMLQSIRLLSDVSESFTDNCIVGIEANRARIKEHLDRSLMLVTALAPHIGYDKAAEIAKAAHKRGTTLREEAVRLGAVSEAEFDRMVRPENMVGPKR